MASASSTTAEPPLRLLNVNVGLLGHIDSGKTALARALSTVASTAAFDKSRQSKERGITLDLGFSSFTTALPERLAHLPYDALQITLVDCPGHASLIRTVIGGAQIIDLMLLVVDAVKGVQTQTAECLVIGEMLCDKMVVALNKVDLFPDDARPAQVERTTTRLAKTLAATRFRGAAIVAVSARPGGPEGQESPAGMEALIAALGRELALPSRRLDAPLIIAVDHCFAVKGTGVVATGTVLQGRVRVNETVEIATLRLERKVKSLQSFHRAVQEAHAGDRVGLSLTHFDAAQLERGYICVPGTLPDVFAAVARVQRVRFYRGPLQSGMRLHVCVGHDTQLATITFFDDGEGASAPSEFSADREYRYLDALGAPDDAAAASEAACWALLEFEQPLFHLPGGHVVGARLDAEPETQKCRIAFHGHLAWCVNQKDQAAAVVPRLVRLYKTKRKTGVVERVVDEHAVIARSLFKKETDLALFAGMQVELSTGDVGVIEGSFGKSGKVRVRVPRGVSPALQLAKGGGRDDAEAREQAKSVAIVLEYRKYVHDAARRVVQRRAADRPGP